MTRAGPRQVRVGVNGAVESDNVNIVLGVSSIHNDHDHLSSLT